MNTIYAQNPRSIRAIHAFHDALKELLKVKPYEEITISELATNAGFARHTFYNHFDCKDDLRNALVDQIINEAFASWMKQDIEQGMSNQYNREPLGPVLFEVWLEHEDLVELLLTMNADDLLIDRLKTNAEAFYFQYMHRKVSGLNQVLFRYIRNLVAFAYAAILIEWFKDGMKVPPKDMGRFVDFFVGLEQRQKAIDQFGESIR